MAITQKSAEVTFFLAQVASPIKGVSRVRKINKTKFHLSWHLVVNLSTKITFSHLLIGRNRTLVHLDPSNRLALIHTKMLARQSNHRQIWIHHWKNWNIAIPQVWFLFYYSIFNTNIYFTFFVMTVKCESCIIFENVW